MAPMTKIKIRLDDPKTRAVWDTVLRAREEVAAWPAWKRGEESSGGPATAPAAPIRFEPL